jgi:hypothetical protein
MGAVNERTNDGLCFRQRSGPSALFQAGGDLAWPGLGVTSTGTRADFQMSECAEEGHSLTYACLSVFKGPNGGCRVSRVARNNAGGSDASLLLFSLAA